MLREVDTNLWVVEGDVWLPGRVHFPVRATMVRDASGDVLIYSPVDFAADDVAAIKGLGPVKTILAPNAFHNLHAASAREKFPGARLLVSPAIANRPKIAGKISFDDVLPPGNTAPIAADCHLAAVAGSPKLQEFVLFHAPSRSLVVADLLFNITRSRNLMTALVLTLSGTRGRLAQSRLWKQQTKDRTAAADSVRQIMAWDFDRLIVCHGDIVETGAKSHVTGPLQWMLAGPGS